MYLHGLRELAMGERGAMRLYGRYTAGQVLYDGNPEFGVVLRVVESSPWVECAPKGADGRPLDDRASDDSLVVVERIPQSVAGQAAVDAYHARYDRPVRENAAGELTVNAHRGDVFSVESGHVRRLARDHKRPPLGLGDGDVVPVVGFNRGEVDVVYPMPADGWYETQAMASPANVRPYFFRVERGLVGELIDVGSLDKRYGLEWSPQHVGEMRFRHEHGVANAPSALPILEMDR